MNETILVVDDNKINRRLLSGMLASEGYKTIEAEDGPQALRMVSQQRPDAAMLDIMMPGMDGYEVYKQMKGEAGEQCMPVLFLSALDGIDDKVQGMELGAEDYITKPFERREVMVRLRSHLDRFQHRLGLSENLRSLEVKSERREDEISAGVKMQQSLLASVATLRPTLELSARRYPPMQLSSEMHVAIRLNRHALFFAVLDLGGEGFSGAMAAVSLARLLHGRPGGLLRPKLKDQPGYAVARPAQVIRSLAKEFPMPGMDYPASINVMIVDPEKGEVSYANLGGANPLLVRKSGEMEWLKGDVPPVGTSSDDGFRQGEFVAAKGDKLIFATDGVYHACDKHGNPFGKSALVDRIRASASENLEAMVTAADQAVARWTQKSRSPQERTLVGLEFKM